MPIELLLLLLPVAAASGWLAAQRSMRQRAAGRDEPKFDPVYLKGLNYLLNEEPDRAIDLFVTMLEIDSETVETHLALGNLFRRRGEVERAIRIHQNLIARPTLQPHQRTEALLELGVDYMRAGLFDRAENLFLELKTSDHYAARALTHLLSIYQDEKEWRKCLDVAQQLEVVNKRPYRQQIAHYYCELAEIALMQKDWREASKLLEKGRSFDKASVRTILLQGRVESEQGEFKAAINHYQQLSQLAPSYLSEVLSSLVYCYQQLGRQQAMVGFLRQHYQQHKDAAVMTAISNLIEEDREAASAFVLAHLQNSPDLHGVERLIALNLDGKGSLDGQTLQVLRDLVAKSLLDRPAYRCDECGFEATNLHWQCPSCHTWDGVKPVAALV